MRHVEPTKLTMTITLPLLVKKAKACDLCEIGTRSKRRIIFRGDYPCDVLFVGEAAGDTEKVLGEPFVGPAGRLLDAMIEEALPKAKCFFTNSIYCVPTDPNTRRLRAPLKSEVTSCNTHLRDIITITKPKAIVAVGNVGDGACKKAKCHDQFHYLKIMHPASILRQEDSELDYARTVHVLKELNSWLQKNRNRKT